MTPDERVRARIVKRDGCWIWQGRTAGGVPIFEVDGLRVSVRRWLWNKGPRPEYIGATCRDRLCVRPYHLIDARVQPKLEPPFPDEIVSYMTKSPCDHIGCMRTFDLSPRQLIEILNAYYLGQPLPTSDAAHIATDIDYPLRRFRGGNTDSPRVPTSRRSSADDQ